VVVTFVTKPVDKMARPMN